MSILISEFCNLLLTDNRFVGDVIEFGTGPGTSTAFLGSTLKNKNIITFDGFVGLPETKKGIPTNTEWYPGNYCYDYEIIKNRLSQFHNVSVYKKMSWEIINKNDFKINEVAGINIDFDLYEGTIDALRFITNCKWNNLLVRFDDWGSYPHQIASEVDMHEKEAFYDWIKETNYEYIEHDKLTKLSNGLQSIFEVKR